MRKSLLEADPAIDAVTVPGLVGIAMAIERESASRYAALAQQMQQRGDAATAEAFRAMHDEERAHETAVARWAASLGELQADAARFEWHVPPEMAQAWDEVSGSAMLTPYRAFAIAVDNEMRAFALYSYLAAHAPDAAVAAQAERLALEELRHAALLRRWRRRAYHRERRAAQVPAAIPATADALAALIARHEAVVAQRCRAAAEALRAVGDDESARRVEALIRGVAEQGAGVAADGALPALVALQRALEELSEALEAVMRATDGPLFESAEQALGDVVRRLAQLVLHIERRVRTQLEPS